MADINSNLPTRDTSDGTIGSAVPSIGIQVAGKNNAGNLTAISIDAQNGILIAGEGTAGTPIGGVVSIQGVASGTAVPISAAALPLPTGAATAALQTTGNTSLANIDAGIPVALGPTSSANSMPVVDILTTGAQYRAQSITTTAALALGGSSALTNRKMIQITPTNGTIYYGFDSSVTTTNGSPLFSNQTLFLAIGTGVTVYVIAAATVDSRIAELS